MRFLGLVLFVVACSASKPAEVPVSPVPKPVPDSDFCAAAERQLEKLECRDPRGDPMWVNRSGERFADTCRKIQDEGGIFLDPRCIASAKTCQEANACPAAE